MKRLLIAFLLARSSVAMAAFYSTAFPGTENPISESGAWSGGGFTTGNLWNDARTTPGFVFGKMDPSGANFKDSVQHLSATYGNTQWAKATYHRVTTDSVVFEEAELLLRFNISANSATGYEFTFSGKPKGSSAGAYVQINRWDGGLGSFTLLDSRGTESLLDGTILGATISGSTLTIYTNGVSVFSVTDATFASGHPGVGFYSFNGTGGNANFGETTFQAGDADPVIGTQPQNQTVNVGQNATFTIVAGGFTALSYQWKFNGSNVGSNSSSYTRSNCQLVDSGGSVTCVVTDTAGNVTSGAATLTVNSTAVAVGSAVSVTGGLQNNGTITISN